MPHSRTDSTMVPIAGHAEGSLLWFKRLGFEPLCLGLNLGFLVLTASTLIKPSTLIEPSSVSHIALV